MIGILLIAAVIAFALLIAAALRLSGLVSTLLAAYLALLANVGFVTFALSPVREVTVAGLVLAEAVLLAGAFAFWWLRGRPRPPLGSAKAAARRIFTDPVVAVFAVAVLVLLVYEFVLGVSVPPTNGDALAYHLSKAAAWAQHGGIYWIPNASSNRMNVFQPLAEQQILFLFVATKSGSLIALPQFLSELAILVSVYGAARRLGFELRSAACASFLVATFSVVAIEASDAQNDLVAASLPAVALCFLLGRGRLEAALGGVAVALAIGTKLDTLFVLPILVWVAWAKGRGRTLAWGTVGGIAGLLVVGMWSFVLNIISTGHLLAAGSGAAEDRSSPSYPRSVSNAFNLVYSWMDLSVMSDRLIFVLAVIGVVAGIATVIWTIRRRGGAGQAGVDGVAVGLPFLAPLLVFCGSGVVAFGAARWGFPIRGPNGFTHYVDYDLNETWTRISNENYSTLGPLGIIALLAAAAVAVYSYARRRVDARHLALAFAIPLFLVLMALEASFSIWIGRFVVGPAVLTAPLLAGLMRAPAARAAYLAVALIVVGLTLAHNQARPLLNPYGYGPPWDLTLSKALSTNSRPDYASAVTAYHAIVPPTACVGGVLGDNEPAYYLYGPTFQHRVFYLSSDAAVLEAVHDNLFYVVISTGPNAPTANLFQAAGWKIQPLGTYWQLASFPHDGLDPSKCSS